jgi:tRNA acetyltransferase TAN1
VNSAKSTTEIELPFEFQAKIEDMKNAAGVLFDKHFLKEPSTFAINFNKRFNNDLNRDEVIKELAELVAMKNPGNKVNLKNPEVRL